MTLQRARELVYNTDCKVLRVDDNEYGIGILAYSHYYRACIQFYFSKTCDYIDQQILSPVSVNRAAQLQVIGDKLVFLV